MGAYYNSQVEGATNAILTTIRSWPDHHLFTPQICEALSQAADALVSADEAARRMCEKLEHSTPAEMGWPDLTAEELVESERRAWLDEDSSVVST